MQRLTNIRIFLVLLFISGSISLRAQNIQLHVNPHPSPYLSDWQSHRETASLTITNTGTSALSFKVNTQLYNGNGTMIAETDISKMPVEKLDPGGIYQRSFEDIYPEAAVKYHANYDVNSMTRSGRLKDDNYRICVQLKDPLTGVELTASQCQYFNIVAYQQPTLIVTTPAKDGDPKSLGWTPVRPRDHDDNAIMNDPWTPVWPECRSCPIVVAPDDRDNANMNDPWTPVWPECRSCPIIAVSDVRKQFFKWTPVQPRPPYIVTYRLMVMEILDGQEPGQAFRTNRPILEKDFKNITQTSWPIEYQLPEVHKSYVWSVQAFDDQDRPIGANDGYAEYAAFSIRRDVDPKGRPSSALITPGNNSSLTETDLKKPGTFTWTPVQPSLLKSEVSYRLVVMKVDKRQDPIHAYRTNKPILERDFKNRIAASWPDDAPALEPGETYVWSVLAIGADGNPVRSREVGSGYSTFRIRRNVRP